MRKWLRNTIPYALRLQIKLIQRYWEECRTTFSYAKTWRQERIGNEKIEEIQIIKKGAFFENKIHNLKLASQKIHHIVILPNEVFSFWKLVGNPSKKNGFREGRNLKNNQVSQDFGGGICQLSSLLYYTSLQAGLKIIERNSHSMDIYKEHERFAPLGSDCTVAFGYKDFQFQNVYPYPIQIACCVTDENVSVEIISDEKLKKKKISFTYIETQNGVFVRTSDEEKTLFKNFYLRV